MPKRIDNTGGLVFENGKFTLLEVGSAKLRAALGKNARWRPVENDGFETTDLGAAVKFRAVADEACKNLFTKALQEHYPKFISWPLDGLFTLLDKTQREGVTWVLERKRSYLAHAPGAGKTAIAITAACLHAGPGPVLFIVPPSLTKNWEREIEKFSPYAGHYGKAVIVPRSENKKEMNWNAHFIICPDSMLARRWVHDGIRKLKPSFIAIDEASRFKTPNSVRSIAFFGGRTEKEGTYYGLFRQAKHVVLLDGSPMPNRPIELWGPTYALHPEAIDFTDYDDYGYRYCGAKPNERGVWEYLYSSNEDELRKKLRHDFMHVVTESELDHPERRRSMVVMSEDVRTKDHREWEQKHLSKITLSEKTSEGDLARWRRELGLQKVPWVITYVTERCREKNESILLFTWHRDVSKALGVGLGKRGIAYATIMGGVSNEERERIVKEFQDRKIKVLVLNITAAGRGYNLQRADRVIFAEFSWTDETNKQAEKRASRKGSEKSFVRCEYIVAPNSMDEIVLNSVFSKERRVGRIIG